tara:strand:+ start:2603 stop:3364 length:762 start_codon:yes stop_codon:yes gene_type:complete
MKITKEDLRRIIVEEYIKEESLDEDNVDDLIDWIKGGEEPEWATTGPRNPPPPPKVPPTDSDDTQPMDIPSDDDPESEYSGFQDDSGPPVEDRLSALIQGMEPEAVAELFQSVFEKIPGVDLSSPGDEDYPGESDTEYVPGAQGRQKISLGPVRESSQLEQLTSLIEEVMNEDEWFDITAGDHPPPHSTQAEPSSKEKLEQVYQLLDSTVGEYPPDTHEYSVLKSALDSITNILDGLDTGDNMARADENLIDV